MVALANTVSNSMHLLFAYGSIHSTISTTSMYSDYSYYNSIIAKIS